MKTIYKQAYTKKNTNAPATIRVREDNDDFVVSLNISFRFPTKKRAWTKIQALVAYITKRGYAPVE